MIEVPPNLEVSTTAAGPDGEFEASLSFPVDTAEAEADPPGVGYAQGALRWQLDRWCAYHRFTWRNMQSYADVQDPPEQTVIRVVCTAAPRP